MCHKINLHTHSSFCDGKNTAEEMVLSSIQKGFTVLGFSSHSIINAQTNWHLKKDDYLTYKNTILELKEKYKNQIELFFGFESDFIQDLNIPNHNFYKDYKPDYLIGSVHFLKDFDNNFTVDDSLENFKKGLQDIYHNDGKSLVCEYFETQRKMLDSGDFEIWGHADLVRVRNYVLNFFSETESWYKEQVELTVKTASKRNVVAEINSGAIARGLFDDFYPSTFMLELLYKYKVPICVNSDAHNKDFLDCAFERAYMHAKKIGYKELIYPVANKEYVIKL